MFDRVAWEAMHARLRKTWKQGEHAVIIAPTGRGKTVLMQQLLPMRKDVVFFGTKTYDEEYDRLMTQQGFRRVKKWPPPPYYDRVMFWPEIGQDMEETRAIQKVRFKQALSRIFRNGKWTCCFDELHWMAKSLGLYEDIEHMHHQGRSSKLTLIDGFQRPAFVPVIVYSSATHVFAWGTNTKADLQKLQSVAKLDDLSYRQLQAQFGSLDEHDFVYVNTRDNRPPVVSKVERA